MIKARIFRGEVDGDDTVAIGGDEIIGLAARRQRRHPQALAIFGTGLFDQPGEIASIVADERHAGGEEPGAYQPAFASRLGYRIVVVIEQFGEAIERVGLVNARAIGHFGAEQGLFAEAVEAGERHVAQHLR